MKNDYRVDPTLTTDILKRRDENKTMYIFGDSDGESCGR